MWGKLTKLQKPNSRLNHSLHYHLIRYKPFQIMSIPIRESSGSQFNCNFTDTIDAMIQNARDHSQLTLSKDGCTFLAKSQLMRHIRNHGAHYRITSFQSVIDILQSYCPYLITNVTLGATLNHQNCITGLHFDDVSSLNLHSHISYRVWLSLEDVGNLPLMICAKSELREKENTSNESRRELDFFQRYLEFGENYVFYDMQNDDAILFENSDVAHCAIDLRNGKSRKVLIINVLCSKNNEEGNHV